MPILYHLLPPTEWETALRGEQYHPASLASEGFIHFSTQAQLLGSATQFFTDADELVVLEVPEKRLKPQLKYEAAPDGRLFPHYYGPLDLALVENTRLLFRNAQGEWEWD